MAGTEPTTSTGGRRPAGRKVGASMFFLCCRLLARLSQVQLKLVSHQGRPRPWCRFLLWQPLCVWRGVQQRTWVNRCRINKGSVRTWVNRCRINKASVQTLEGIPWLSFGDSVAVLAQANLRFQSFGLNVASTWQVDKVQDLKDDHSLRSMVQVSCFV